MWSPEREARFAGFPVADPRPPVIMGVSSEALAAIAGRRCDGINVRSEHANAAELLASARVARAEVDPEGRRPWIVTASKFYEDGVLDPEHPERVRLAALGVDRMIIVSGAFNLGTGETFDSARTIPLYAGYAHWPNKGAFFAFTKEETVVEIQGVGPWAVNYLNAADDPMAQRRLSSSATR